MPRVVDRAEQTYERLPDAPMPVSARDDFPLKLPGNVSYRPLDSISFAQDGKRYRLAHLDPVPSGETCVEASGTKWACGLRARVALGRLLERQRLECKAVGEQEKFMLVECLRQKEDLGGTLAAGGHAMAQSGDDRYRVQEEDARRRKVGVWSPSSEQE